MRRAARGVMSTGGAREGNPADFAADEDEEDIVACVKRTWFFLCSECECSCQKDSYVLPVCECAEAGDCAAEPDCGYA